MKFVERAFEYVIEGSFVAKVGAEISLIARDRKFFPIDSIESSPKVSTTTSGNNCRLSNIHFETRASLEDVKVIFDGMKFGDDVLATDSAIVGKELRTEAFDSFQHIE